MIDIYNATEIPCFDFIYRFLVVFIQDSQHYVHSRHLGCLNYSGMFVPSRVACSVK